MSLSPCVLFCGDPGGDWRSAGCRDWAQGLTVVDGRVGGLPELFAIHWIDMRVPGLIQGGIEQVRCED